MAHKTIIGGTSYGITGGKTLVGGTAYSIKKGKTLIGGTAYDITFSKPTVTVSAINVPEVNWQRENPYASMDITTEGSTDSGYTFDFTEELPVGSIVTVYVNSDGYQTSVIRYNGSTVASGGFNGNNISYSVVLEDGMTSVDISFTKVRYKLSSGGVQYAMEVDITTS